MVDTVYCGRGLGVGFGSREHYLTANCLPPTLSHRQLLTADAISWLAAYHYRLIACSCIYTTHNALDQAELMCRGWHTIL